MPSLCTMAICEVDAPALRELRRMTMHPERGATPPYDEMGSRYVDCVVPHRALRGRARGLPRVAVVRGAHARRL